jgi:predicted enzyme related to lactoylglutathione lyase
MPETAKYAQGTPSWLDLATPDMGAAETFYGKLFGWQCKREPTGNGMFYSMQSLKGKNVAGIMEQSAEQVAQGIPPTWTTYITVDDVDGVTAKAKGLGGKIVVEPMDVLDSGRMSMLQDPEGAFFALWQPRNHFGAGLVNEHGCVIWNELVADDPSRAATFYAKLLDIELKDMEEMPGYKLFTVGGRSVAGIFQKNEQMKQLPSYWSVYFAVNDCDAIVKKATALGGGVVMPPMDSGMGRMAALKDPQGAVFQIITYTGP